MCKRVVNSNPRSISTRSQVEISITSRAGRIPYSRATMLPVAFPSMAEGTTPRPKTKRVPSAAFMKPVQPDEKLAVIIGSQPLPRTEITKRVWEYVRSHSLQDPDKKTVIRADDKLREVFDGKDSVTMFEMTKLIFGHVK